MLYSLAIIFLLSLCIITIFNKLKLPSLLGIILLGIFLGPYCFNLIDSSLLNISNDLRQIALVIILTRAGLSLNIDELKKLGFSTILLCFLPACLEILGVCIIAPLIFPISILDAFVIGSVLAAVSPAVLVPRMIRLIDEGYGSIPQMLLAAASVDDVFVLILFSSFTTLASTSQISIQSFIQIPVSIISGILLGIICGILLSKFLKRYHFATTYRIIILLSISFLLLTLEQSLKPLISISALLAIMTYAMVLKYQNKELASQFSSSFHSLWQLFEILLFFLVGTCVDLRYLLQAGLISIIVILIALLFRMFGVWISVLPSSLNNKERLFCMIAYIPKATVQAGIASIPMQMGLSCGSLCLTLGVVSILLTATLGAIGIDCSYQKLLKKQ